MFVRNVLVILLFSCVRSEKLAAPPPVFELPDFNRITVGSERKQSFFQFLTPLVQYENARIQLDRQRAIGLFRAVNDKERIETGDSIWLSKQAETFGLKAVIPDSSQQVEWLRRMDALPLPLVLAQAAIESSWGTSRFAMEANNLFGEWCFRKGCGLVPLERDNDASHEVRKFDTVNQSVASYFQNLNSHRAYLHLRNIRAQFREQGQPLDAHELAKGLQNYSVGRKSYVRKVQQIILDYQTSHAWSP